LCRSNDRDSESYFNHPLIETGGNISVIGRSPLMGYAPMMIEWAIDGQVLELYIQHFLAPQLRPRDIVICDNLPTDESSNVLALIEAPEAWCQSLSALFCLAQITASLTAE
jgi:hypothetical protein